MFGLGGVFFDVAAEADDEVVDGARVGVFMQAPDVFEDGLARDGAAFAANQVAQQLGFHERELDRGVVDAKFQRSEIYRLAVERKYFGIAGSVCAGGVGVCSGILTIGRAALWRSFFSDEPLAAPQQALQ